MRYQTNPRSIYRQWMWFCLVLSCGVVVSTTAVGRTEELAVSSFKSDGLAGWQEKVFKGNTDYRVVKDNGRVVVQAISHSAASGLVKEITFNPAEFRYLRWSWKIEGPIAGGDETTKAGDDYSARLYVVFPGSFFWQTRAINYIWANQLARGQSIPNAFTGQAMMLAVESGPLLAGRWLEEERDIWSDYKRLFGEEPKKAAAIAIMTDTDNTGERAVAWYGDIILSTSPRSLSGPTDSHDGLPEESKLLASDLLLYFSVTSFQQAQQSIFAIQQYRFRNIPALAP